MNVFVAGASGVIGRPLVRQLVETGHRVTGMTRRVEAARELEAAGSAAVVCDVFDAAGVKAAMAEARPRAVIHQLTALPPDVDPRRKGVYEATNRIRREGTRVLIEAARAAGARRFIAQSIAFIYAPGEGPAAEADPILRMPGEFGGAIEAVLDLESQVTAAEGLEGVVLRYGFFYGPRSSYAPEGHQAREVRRRRFPIVGAGTGVFSYIHVEDAAAATVAAVERGDPGIYNVVDDDPAPLRDWLPVYAEAVGAKRPLRIPKLIARLVAGPAVVAMATTLRGASNAKAKRELGWELRYPSWRQGFARALG